MNIRVTLQRFDNDVPSKSQMFDIAGSLAGIYKPLFERSGII
jgi:hypothetical protein